MDEELCHGHVSDNEKGIEYFNKVCERSRVAFRLPLPRRRFKRRIGMFSEARFDPRSPVIDEARWSAQVGSSLPTEADRAYVQSLMVPCHQPGKIAGWTARPVKGIDGKPSGSS